MAVFILLRPPGVRSSLIVLEERDMDIMIEQPIWLSIWALLLYALVIAAIVTITLRGYRALY